jgi:hypothetical protein
MFFPARQSSPQGFVGDVWCGLTQEISQYVHASQATTIEQLAQRSTAEFSYDQSVVAQLARDGICLTSLDALGLPGTAAFWQAANRIMHTMPCQPQQIVDAHDYWNVAQCAVNLTAIDLIQQAPDLYLFGLQTRLLKLIETYLAAPIYYLSADLRRDLVNGREVGSRTWHRDSEDRRMIKIIIYLKDVSPTGGAFEYIPKAHAMTWWRLGRKASLTNQELAAKIPPQFWQRCPGPAGTVILVDVARLWHHGTVPEQERFSLFYTYTSRRPSKIKSYTWLTQEPYAAQVRQILQPWQREYLLRPDVG